MSNAKNLPPVGRGNECFTGSICGHMHGHDIAFDRNAGVWRYCDTGEIAQPANARPCQKCELDPKDYGDHDPCIANLPGVRNACCGHGRAEGYIQFDDGMLIRGRFEICNGPAGREHIVGDTGESGGRPPPSAPDEISAAPVPPPSRRPASSGENHG